MLVPELSAADHAVSPPRLAFPAQYNAADDLIVRNLLAGRGSKTVYFDDEHALTYAQLDQWTSAFARFLLGKGLHREQRVLLCMQDSVELPIAFLGCIRAGVIPVPVNTLLTKEDYEFLATDTRASLAIVSPSQLPHFVAVRERVPTLTSLLVADGRGDHPDSLWYSIEVHQGSWTSAASHPDEPCFWLYSSGSTGRPKGTVHAHSSLVTTAELYARGVLGLGPDDVCFSAAKLFFAYGLGNSLSFPLAVGASCVLMAERATPGAVFARLRSAGATVFSGVPTLYAAMLASPELPEPCETRLRRCVSAGEPLPAAIGERWQSRMGTEIIDGIGSTEMLHIFISNRPGGVRYGTTGTPVPGYEARLVDEQDHAVGPDEPGELQVRGPSSALYYWNNRERSRSTFLGAWTRTGDKFVQREDGAYVYSGRSDDMLKVSGIYVSPAEVEAALISHASVLEAAVIGRADGDGLVKPMAFVVLKGESARHDALEVELKTHVKSLLAPYKYPRWIEFVDELPKTATGKIQRFVLRERLRAP